MRVCVVATGRLKPKDPERQLADEYTARITRYVRFQEIEVARSEQLAARAPAGYWRIALEVDGASVSSSGLARALQRWGQRGKGEVCFLIGGAEGIPSDLSHQADEKLSLSTLTLPHRLARVLLYEQLYRAFSILNNEPYAREKDR